jgi:RHS repeat-associated protein
VQFGHSYNGANQRTGQTVSDSSWLSYPAATPATTAYTANSLNQYTAVGAVTPTWDGNGNLTFDGTSTLGYDPENRLTSASGAGTTAAYAFDAQSRRKVRTVNGTTTITVTGADNRELLDYDGSSGAILRWYAYGPGPNAVLNQMNVAAGSRDTLLPDLLGSIVASVDSGTGTIAPFAYRPYGTTSAAPAQFGYTGQRVDQETGLYYYRARHYSPQWGRFAQADPIGYSGGINLYGYVGNDPLNAIDPLGLDTQLTIGLGGTAALQPFGFGGSYSVGISVPDNPLSIRGYQLIVGQVQANAMVGVGGFGGCPALC